MKTVISASRRTDLPLGYPGWLARAIHQGWVRVKPPWGGQEKVVSLRPEDVHTFVLWSKDYSRLLANRGGLREALAVYEHIFCHFTVTGLGGPPGARGSSLEGGDGAVVPSCPVRGPSPPGHRPLRPYHPLEGGWGQK